MSTDRETTRIVRSWLEDGVTQLPDNVLDAVVDQLPTTHQRRATWWPVRRLPDMKNTARLALGAAAIVVAALFGFTMLGGGNFGAPGVNVGDETPGPTADPDEALMRAWVDAVNRGDRDALVAMTADRVATADRGDLTPEEVASYVLGAWCLMTVNDVERVGDAFLVGVSFRDNADSSCTDAAPGTTGTIVIEVRDGKVSRIP